MARIRMAEVKDAANLLAIYRDYIPTTITFEYETPSEEEFASRVRRVLEEYPYLLWEEEGKVLGYAYAHRAQERAAYQWNAELSVYVAKDAHGRGIGKALYCALLELLEVQGVRNVYGVITGENRKSVEFHRNLGFTEAGVWHRTGFKNGKWLDVVWMEKRFGGDDAPVPMRPIAQIDAVCVEGVLAKHENL